MGGAVSGVTQKIGGGKSSPAPQNAYGSSYQAPAANVYQPSYGNETSGSNTATPMPIMNSKSSGAGEGGYGAVPAFDGQMTGGPGAPPPSFNQQPMGGIGQAAQNLVGGKSSGMGQGGYQSAPSFSPFQQQQQFSPFQQQFNQQPRQQFQQQQFSPFHQQQFSPFQQQQQFSPFQQQQFNPFQQQFGGFQQQPQGASGLQALFNNMMSQQQQMQRPMQQMPQYQNPALQYRPNMQNAQAALSRVKPSVQKQQQDANLARIAELEAQLSGFQNSTSTPWNSGFDSGGG